MATSDNYPLPSLIDLRRDLASNWQFFKEHWEDYITTTEGAGKGESIKAALLYPNSYGSRLPQVIKIN